MEQNERKTCMTCAHHGMLTRDADVEEHMPALVHACIEFMVYWVEHDQYAINCDSWEPDGSAE